MTAPGGPGPSLNHLDTTASGLPLPPLPVFFGEQPPLPVPPEAGSGANDRVSPGQLMAGALVVNILALGAAFGLHLTADQQGSIVALTATISGLVAAWTHRR